MHHEAPVTPMGFAVQSHVHFRVYKVQVNAPWSPCHTDGLCCTKLVIFQSLESDRGSQHTCFIPRAFCTNSNLSVWWIAFWDLLFHCGPCWCTRGPTAASRSLARCLLCSGGRGYVQELSTGQPPCFVQAADLHVTARRNRSHRCVARKHSVWICNEFCIKKTAQSAKIQT